MSASSAKKRVLASEGDAAAIRCNTRSAAGGGSERAAFALESVQAGVRSATVAALPSATAAEVDNVLADATVHFLTLDDHSSWVLHVPRWHRRIRDARGESEAEWFEEIWRLHPDHHDEIVMFGRAVPTPRFQQAFGESYRFSGHTFAALPVPEALRACVETLQAMVVDPQDATRSFLRGALVNWYANGEHYIGPHSDGESSLLRHSPVLSLSLGAARKFVFSAKRSTKRKRQQEGGGGEAAGGGGSGDASGGVVQRLELLLQDGDLVVMGGTTQQTHKHALPKMKRCLERRVSVTMRCFRD